MESSSFWAWQATGDLEVVEPLTGVPDPLRQLRRGVVGRRADHPKVRLRDGFRQLHERKRALVGDQPADPEERLRLLGRWLGWLGEARDRHHGAQVLATGQLLLMPPLGDDQIRPTQGEAREDELESAAVRALEVEVEIEGGREDEPAPADPAEEGGDEQVGPAAAEEVDGRIGLLHRPPHAARLAELPPHPVPGPVPALDEVRAATLRLPAAWIDDHCHLPAPLREAGGQQGHLQLSPAGLRNAGRAGGRAAPPEEGSGHRDIDRYVAPLPACSGHWLTGSGLSLSRSASSCRARPSASDTCGL